jgi:hypothetical protein
MPVIRAFLLPVLTLGACSPMPYPVPAAPVLNRCLALHYSPTPSPLEGWQVAESIQVSGPKPVGRRPPDSSQVVRRDGVLRPVIPRDIGDSIGTWSLSGDTLVFSFRSGWSQRRLTFPNIRSLTGGKWEQSEEFRTTTGTVRGRAFGCPSTLGPIVGLSSQS